MGEKEKMKRHGLYFAFSCFPDFLFKSQFNKVLNCVTDYNNSGAVAGHTKLNDLR